MAGERSQAQVKYHYRTRYGYRERLAGAFVLGALAILMILLVSSDAMRAMLEERMVIYGRLATAQGVGPDTLVRLSGIQVGAVTAVEFTPDNDIRIAMTLPKRFGSRLRRDAEAKLSSLALLGKTYVDISPGTPTAAPLPAESEIPIREAPDLDQIVARVEPALEALERTVLDVATIVAAVDPAAINTMVTDAGDTAEDLRTLIGRIEAGEGTLGTVLRDQTLAGDLRSGVTRLNEILALAEDTLTQAQARLIQLEPVLGDADSISSDTRAAMEQLPTLVTEAQAAVSQFNLALATVNTELQQLPELTLRVKLLLDETNETLEGMQRVWPLSEAVSQPAAEILVPAQPLND